MGHLFEAAGLTVPNSMLMSSSGQPQFIGAPQQVLKQAMNQPGATDFESGNFAPARIGTPTPQQAAQAGATPGGVNAMSPALTKGGKLVTLLMSGLQGALAGRAASEQALIQSGGRRSGGVGTGFEAGYTLPWQRAMLPLEYQKAQAETQLAQAGARPIQTEYGTIPTAYLPKFLSPMLRLEGTRETNQTRQGIAGETNQTRQNIANQGNQTRQNIANQSNQTRRDVAAMNLGPMADVAPELQQQFGLPPQLPLRMLNQAESAANRPLTTVQGEAGPAIVNKQTGQSRSLGLGAPALGRGTVIGDVNNPGETTFSTMGNAIRTGAPGPQSASVQVPRAAARAEVPTKIGDLKVAFNTAIAHADLLRQAAKALNNRDSQTLSGLKNRFKNEFGWSGPITAQAIADAYTRETTSMLSKGHITNDEIATVGKTVDPTRQNYQTVDSVLGAYQALAQSKMNMLNQQKQSAIQQSQPKNGNSAPKTIHYKLQNGQLVPAQ